MSRSLYYSLIASVSFEEALSFILWSKSVNWANFLVFSLVFSCIDPNSQLLFLSRFFNKRSSWFLFLICFLNLHIYLLYLALFFLLFTSYFFYSQFYFSIYFRIDAISELSSFRTSIRLFCRNVYFFHFLPDYFFWVLNFEFAICWMIFCSLYSSIFMIFI